MQCKLCNTNVPALMFKFSTAESLIINILGVAIDEKLIEGSHIDTVVKEHTRSRAFCGVIFYLILLDMRNLLSTRQKEGD